MAGEESKSIQNSVAWDAWRRLEVYMWTCAAYMCYMCIIYKRREEERAKSQQRAPERIDNVLQFSLLPYHVIACRIDSPGILHLLLEMLFLEM